MTHLVKGVTHLKAAVTVRFFPPLEPGLAFINTESINLEFEFHFMLPLWPLRLKA